MPAGVGRPFDKSSLVTLADPLSVSELSARLGIGLATTSLLVGELGRVGIVMRTEDETDRRRMIVDLAPAQREAIAAFVGRRAGIIKSALEGLNADERAVPIKGLRAIVAASTLLRSKRHSSCGCPDRLVFDESPSS
jgi:DNA-binding MarR family transcriptional regulator